MLSTRFRRHFLPGLVMRSVLVGATYATGREITEYFLKYGAFSSLIGLLITTTLFSSACIIALELARRYRVFDYKSFSELYMGPFWFMYELGFLYGVVMTLSIIGAASGEITSDLFGISPLTGTWVVMIAIAMLVCLGSSRIERVMSAWSIFFYFAYAVLMLLSLYFFGAKVPEKLLPQAIRIEAIGSAAVYAGFCCAILPVVIFVARHLESRKDAVIAGSLAGPLVFLPGLALLMILIPFYPEIVTAPVPIMNVLN